MAIFFSVVFWVSALFYGVGGLLSAIKGLDISSTLLSMTVINAPAVMMVAMIINLVRLYRNDVLPKHQVYYPYILLWAVWNICLISWIDSNMGSLKLAGVILIAAVACIVSLISLTRKDEMMIASNCMIFVGTVLMPLVMLIFSVRYVPENDLTLMYTIPVQMSLFLFLLLRIQSTE